MNTTTLRPGLTPLGDDASKLSRWSTAESLVTLDADGGAQPGLATAWEQTDPKTWTLHRDGRFRRDSGV